MLGIVSVQTDNKSKVGRTWGRAVLVLIGLFLLFWCG